MPIRQIAARGTFDAAEIRILTEAFEVALRLSATENRASPRGALLAQRIIHLFESGERDPQMIAKMAAGN
jgi:hypothetical protein